MQKRRAKSQDWPAAYAELLTNLYKHHGRPAPWEAQNEQIHSEWRKGIIEHYAAEDPDNEAFLWCPILREYRLFETRAAAHIVLHSIGYSNAGYLFSEPDNGSGLIWSFRNGIVMPSFLESQFDEGDFILVPVEPTEPVKPCEWSFVLMNEKTRKYPVGETSTTYNELDGPPLEWKNDNRPARRFLSYHLVTTLLRYVRYEKPGWAEKRMTAPTGKLWVTQGPYLQRSMLKQLAAVLGDVNEAEVDKMFADGVFDQKNNKLEGEERLMAQEIFVAHEYTKLEEDDVQVEIVEERVDAGNVRAPGRI